MKVDFVVVAYSVDFELLKLQARSIAQFVDPELVNQIVVVVNDTDPDFIDQVYNIKSLYGQFADRVQFLDYIQVVNKTDLDNSDEYYKKRDWVSAQVARLLVSRTISSDWYINLDCKNIFTRPINKDTFFCNNRAKEIGQISNKTFTDWFWWINCCEYFKFDGSEIFTQRCYSPFVFFTQEVKNLINHNTDRKLAYLLTESYYLAESELADIALYCAWLHSQNRYLMYYCDSAIFRGSILNYQPDCSIHDIHLHRELPELLQNKQKQDAAKTCLVNDTGLLTNTEWEQFLLSFKAKIK